MIAIKTFILIAIGAFALFFIIKGMVTEIKENKCTGCTLPCAKNEDDEKKIKP